MSEEKKDQQDFLSGHEELLNSLNKKKEDTTAKEVVPAVEEPAPEPVVEETVAEEVIVEEVIEEVVPAAEPEPVVEETKEEETVVDQKVVADVPPVVTEVPAKQAPKKKKPANHAEAVKQRHDRVEQAEVKEVLKFINKYVKPAAIGIVVICILFLGNSLVRSGRLKKEAQADSDLMVAQSAQDYQNILDNYGKTPSAPLALMGLAQEEFNAANVAEAAELYGQFLKKYPKHDMAVQAAYNEITCQEAMGQYAEAAAAYGEFKANHENSHLAPVALLGKARCLESMSSYAEAKLVYEDVMAFYPESGWAQLAEQNLNVVNAKLK
ncbi:tetratricopeptide repeat protein [Pontiellaceae bacterium B1224]|nr:tetratricopeptide repeat protein [Pontiellaceae bacterium B1224]